MGTVEVDDPPSAGCDADQVVPPGVIDELQRLFAPRHVDYILQILTAGELAVLDDLADALIIARIKRMTPQRIRRYDTFIPVDAGQQRFYQALQWRWIQQELYLLGTRLRRPPTDKDLFADFKEYRNGPRFRAYFAMKYPKCVRRVKRG